MRCKLNSKLKSSKALSQNVFSSLARTQYISRSFNENFLPLTNVADGNNDDDGC